MFGVLLTSGSCDEKVGSHNTTAISNPEQEGMAEGLYAKGKKSGDTLIGCVSLATLRPGLKSRISCIMET